MSVLPFLDKLTREQVRKKIEENRAAYAILSNIND